MAQFDIVIKNGMVVDGTRAPRFRSDIGIKNGRIAKIGRIAHHEGAKVVDADGQIVAPGFIDLHTHYDAQIFWDPYLTISGYHGITSVVLGNCGFGFAPVRPKDAERAMLTMVRTEAIPLRAMQAAMPFDWETYPQFMDSLDRLPKGMNLLPYVPMNPVLGYVMGIEESKTGRMPTDEEHAEMRRILHEAMDAGACGWSAQRLIPGGPSAVQRDYDGSRRGFPGTHAGELGSEEGRRPFREDRGDQRPSDHVRSSGDERSLPASSSQHDEVAGALPSKGPAGLRTGHDDRRRPDLHVRRLESVR